MPEESPKKRLPRKGDPRTMITGLGSGGLLLAAVVIGFGALAGLVAFDGLPQRGAAIDDGEDVIVSDYDGARRGEPGPLETTAPALPGSGSLPDSRSTRPGPEPTASDPAGEAPAGDVGEPPTDGALLPPAPPASPPSPVPSPPTPGDLAGAAETIDGAVAEATGIEPAIAPAIEPIVRPADAALEGLTGD